MYFSIVFFLSGFGIASLLWAKRNQIRGRQNPALLEIISRGDKRARDLSHDIAHKYAFLKERGGHFIKKQLPFRLRSLLLKVRAQMKKGLAEFAIRLRASRILQKSEGISEFLKNISEIEKGNGEINDIIESNTSSGQKPENGLDYRN